MKKLLILTLFIFIIIQLDSIGQSNFSVPDKITLGSYTGDTVNTTYINYVKSLGLDIAIHGVDSSSSNDFGDLELIAWNLEEQDNWVYHYTHGHYIRWEIDQNSLLNSIDTIPGFKQSGGASNDSVWNSNADSRSELYGPRLNQEYKYRANSPVASGRMTYYAKIRIRTVQTFEEARPVCSIIAKYFDTKDDSSPDNLGNLDTVYTADISTDWSEYIYSFNYNNAPTESFSVPNNIMSQNKFGKGMQLEINSLSSAVTYEIDYIDIYDETIWNQKYIDLGVDSAKTNLKDYIAQSRFLNVKYFYSLDEPSLREHSKPFNIVKDLIEGETGYKPLFTTYYTQYNNKQSGETQFPLIKNFDYEQIMFYYYPVILKKWRNNNYASADADSSILLLHFLRNLLNSSYAEFDDENLWYGLQVHGFQDESYENYDTLRSPSNEEINVQSMMALAHGMKGLFFYNMHSDSSATRYNQGLIDQNNQPTGKYYFLKNDLIPRIRDYLEPHLVNLLYHRNYYNQYCSNSDDDFNFSNNVGGIRSSITINTDSAGTDPFNLVVTQLQDRFSPIDTIYYSITNLITSNAFDCYDDVVINYTPPSIYSSYRNIRFRDVENSFDLTVDNESTSPHSYTLHIDLGDAVFIQTGPVLKIGGNLSVNDTVKNATVLVDSMKIEDGTTLILDGIYKTNSKIHVEDGGLITANLHGGLDFDQSGSIYYEDWSDGLVIRQDSSHPKLQWTEFHPTTSSIKYKIYRKKDTPNFELIQTINSKSITEFIDEDVTISFQHHSNETTADYYIVAVEGQERDVWEDVDTTITARVDPVQGEGQYKIVLDGTENELPKDYSLSGNYPNPFNPSTTIKYALPEISDVRIEIFDITGRLVKDFAFGSQSPGYKETVWHGDNNNGIKVSSGIYIMRFKAAAVKGNRSFLKSHKLVLVK